MKSIADIRVNFRELEGQDLALFLSQLQSMRVQFWKEINETTSNLDDFAKKTTKAFCITSDYGYLLGRYDTIPLPDLITCEDVEVPIGLISEIYVSKQYRKQGIGRSLINHVQEFVGKNHDLPLVLGCDHKLDSFYKLCNFVPINNYQAYTTSLMVWCPTFGSIVERFEKLFLSPNKN